MPTSLVKAQAGFSLRHPRRTASRKAALANRASTESQTTMDNETLIRIAGETQAPEPDENTGREDETPTACGLTRKELRAIVEEMIG